VADQCAQALERARLYAAERAARAEAEAASRAKSDFLATMSHELRTPLNAIQGYAQLLEMEVHGALTAAQRDAVARIDRSQQHLLGLINAVLNLARIESGRVEYACEPVAVEALCASVDPLVRPLFDRRGLAYACAGVPPGLVARGDEEKARQVLLNLLSNAAKFTAAGGRVTLAAARDADGRVTLAVRDTGIGIPADKLGAIFDPFVQVDGSRTRRAEGTGLGLAISRDLARGMGGDLTVESTPGVGSTFTLALPAG
jgi:signal transduction histidine kinase